MVALQFVMSLSITLQVKVSDFSDYISAFQQAHISFLFSPFLYQLFQSSRENGTYSHFQQHLPSVHTHPLGKAYTHKNYNTHTSPQHVHATFMHVFVDNIKQLMWWFFEFLVESLCIQSPTKTYITSEYMIFSLNDQIFLHLVIWLFC